MPAAVATPSPIEARLACTVARSGRQSASAPSTAIARPRPMLNRA
jgi:hypothetical protein